MRRILASVSTFLCFVSVAVAAPAFDRHKPRKTDHAIEHGHCGNGRPTEPLFRAIFDKNLTAVKRALKNGANPNQLRYQETPLTFALDNGQYQIAELLIARGVKVNDPIIRGEDTLMRMARFDAAPVKFLLRHHASVTRKDKSGWTALTYAAVGGRTECVRLLIEAGADINAVDSEGKSVLRRANLAAQSATAKVLEEVGAKE